VEPGVAMVNVSFDDSAPSSRRRLHRIAAAMLASTALCSLAPAPAWAACAPPAGPVVTCTGNTVAQDAPNGFGNSTLDNVTVNVVPGATVQAAFTGEGVQLGVNSTVNNSGGITGDLAGRAGVRFQSFGTVNNLDTGTITGGAGITSQSGVIIVNAGSITSTVFAAITSGGLGPTITNLATGTITGFTNGIEGNGGTVTNYGSISGNIGIQLGPAGATIFNAGTVTGTGGTAIQVLGTSSVTLAPTSVINGNVIDGDLGTLQLGGSGSGSFDAAAIGPAVQYQGFDGFAKVGDATWTLTGNNALALPWSVQQGTLLVNGTLANSTFTVAGGTLAGTGTVGATTVAGGGVLAPGSGVAGTSMTVNGPLAFNAGSIYRVNVNPAAASSATVNGTATLTGGTANAVFAPGAYVTRNYTILTAAGGLGGTAFAGLTTVNLPAGFVAGLGYNGNDVLLALAAQLGLGGALNQNQQNVANSLNTFFNNGGALPPGFITAFGLTGAALGNALTQLSGETATGTQQTTFDAMSQFMGLMTDPFIAGRSDPVSGGGSPNAFAEEESLTYAARGKSRSKSERDAYAAIYTKAPPLVQNFEQRWSVWAAGYGGSQTTDGNAVVGSNTATSRVYGVVAGADYRISPYTLAGFALAGGGTNFSITNALGTGRSDLFQAGAYLRHNVGAAYLTAALAYGWQDITTDRTVTIAGVDRLRAQFNANAWSGRLEGGYRFAAQGIGFTPYAAGQFVTFQLPNYAEAVLSGTNTFALAYAAKDVTASRSELGLRTDKSFAMQDGIFTLRGRAAWAHNFNTDRSALPTFQALPGASFVVNGAGQAADAALATASAEMKWLNGFSVAGTFEGEFSNVTRSYAGKGVVRYAW
jgi:uncharacterized protein with beta-barrel porin domain